MKLTDALGVASGLYHQPRIKRIENPNRNKLCYDSGWCLRADYVLWSCLLPSKGNFNGILSAFFPVILEERQILQRYEEHKFENAIFEKLRLSLTRLQGNFTSNGGFLAVESAPHNLVHSRICQEIDQIMMALPPKSTNFEEDSRYRRYLPTSQVL